MKLIIANWKAYITSKKAAKELVADIIKQKISKEVELVLCPPAVFLADLQKSRSKKFSFGLQNIFWERRGAYTGETTLDMLDDFPARYVILGHSERRTHLGETDEIVNRKIKAVLTAGLKAVLCVGEREREDQKSVPAVVGEQVKRSLAGINPIQLKDLVVAYEPVWAIGTGAPDTPHDALSAAIYIRKVISEMYGSKVGAGIKVLYGGSVNAANVADFINQEGIDGVLIGKASTDKKEFIQILKSIY